MININNASVKDLCKIKGIGKAFGERIINYREKNNGFNSLKELENVKGIGAKKLEKLNKNLSIELKSKEKTRVNIYPRRLNLNIDSKDIKSLKLVGDFNDWDTKDESYQLTKIKQGVYSGVFSGINKGDEYKVFINGSKSWEEGLHFGNKDGSNLSI